jgi:hypothetical protein
MPASGLEKGQVENQVGLVHERFFTPRLRFKTFDELNAWLTDKCIAYAKEHAHPPCADRRLRPIRSAQEPVTMEGTEILDMMGELKLYGMRGAYNEPLTTALKRKHEPRRFVGDLLRAEISDKQARSIKRHLTIAKLPLAKDVDDFAFKDTPINEALVYLRRLARALLHHRRSRQSPQSRSTLWRAATAR